MTQQPKQIRKIRTLRVPTLMRVAVALVCAAALLSYASPQAPPQKSFSTPQEAAQALIRAAADYDVRALMEMFGPHAKGLVVSADPVRDKNNALEFANKARQKNSVEINPANPNRATLVVGSDDWPLPVPIVKRNGKWYFDTKAGRKEILYRRIGANELDAIEICRNYVAAQLKYASETHEGSEVHQYAQKIISSPGKRDGLYWQNADGTSGGPISEGIARAIAEGYSTARRTPYHGYYFKILKGQGPAAPLGRINYVIEGIMIGGFALVAVPAEYRVTGVKTFMVSNDGILYQKDLGPDSLNIVKRMELYNPDPSWQRVTGDASTSASGTPATADSP
jgi:hypothetical protein